jgi:hypothetical protein
MVAIKVRATRKTTSAIFSARRRRLMLRILSAQYARPQALRNNNASIDSKSSTQVLTDLDCKISLSSPITVRHTPTIVAEVVKICIEISSSSAVSERNFSAKWLVLKLFFILSLFYTALTIDTIDFMAQRPHAFDPMGRGWDLLGPSLTSRVGEPVLGFDTSIGSRADTAITPAIT